VISRATTSVLVSRLATGPSWPAATLTNLATNLSLNPGPHRDQAYRATRRAHSLAVWHGAQPRGSASAAVKKPITGDNLGERRLFSPLRRSHKLLHA
jgi:hypothetical protein